MNIPETINKVIDYILGFIHEVKDYIEDVIDFLDFIKDKIDELLDYIEVKMQCIQGIIEELKHYGGTEEAAA
ncbi:hypothetical protein GCM10007424_24320 [Flavobacterium suaedae]|uniref:Uncharacterized protein n=1 Tax=Flavobacterium suaedae TaxID=1767027 RepID=A0ABQ1K184_9FLAO|nr:hypothetical protein [Flavobacterium suaedae]GGB83418.1 hypothetical protein GCM10007424_24320 [Flavobacterium suaedae]